MVSIHRFNRRRSGVLASLSSIRFSTSTRSRIILRYRGFTLVELLVVITIIGILIALLLPAVQAARESARRLQCENNLKQIALGMLNHEQEYKRFPTGGWGWGWVGDPDRGSGKQQPGGWAYNILPYIEQQTLHQLGSDGNPNVISSIQQQGSTTRSQTPLAVMNCPSRRTALVYPYNNGGVTSFTAIGANSASTFARCDYAACMGSNACNQIYGPSSLTDAATMTKNNSWTALSPLGNGLCYYRSEVKMSDITDGTSNTYMIGEKYLNSDHYLDGTDYTDLESMYCGWNDDMFRSTYYAGTGTPTMTPMQDRAGYGPDGYRFGSAHANSFNMAFADGSIQAVSYTIDAITHSRLGNRADGLNVNGSKF